MPDLIERKSNVIKLCTVPYSKAFFKINKVLIHVRNSHSDDSWVVGYNVAVVMLHGATFARFF